jgi:hypothetical protein
MMTEQQMELGYKQLVEASADYKRCHAESRPDPNRLMAARDTITKLFKQGAFGALNPRHKELWGQQLQGLHALHDFDLDMALLDAVCEALAEPD